MLNAELIEAEYGYLGDAIFLNTSSVAVPPSRVRNACRRCMDDLAQAYGIPAYDEYDNIRSQTKSLLGSLIHCQPDEIAFTKNTTEGNSLLARGLDLKGGDSVIICDMEHPSLLYPWLYSQRRGIDVRIVKSHNGSFSLEDIAALTDKSTKVIAVSAVQYGSGYLADLKGIGTFCAENHIIFAVDGIQAVGKIPIDVQKMHIDYLTCGAFKGLLGSLGIGFLYCRRDLIPHIEPCKISYHTAENYVDAPDILQDFSPPLLRTDIHRLEAGSSNTYGIISLNKGVELILELGVSNIFFHIMELEKQLRGRLYGSGYEFYEHDPNVGFSGIISLRFPENGTELLKKAFAENRVYATVKKGYVRMALEFFNTGEQMDRLAHILLDCRKQMK